MINDMKHKARGAPKDNQAGIDIAPDLYQTGQLNNRRTLDNAIIALTYPALFGKQKTEAVYHKAAGQFIKQKALTRKIKME